MRIPTLPPLARDSVGQKAGSQQSSDWGRGDFQNMYSDEKFAALETAIWGLYAGKCQTSGPPNKRTLGHMGAVKVCAYVVNLVGKLLLPITRERGSAEGWE